MTTGWAHIEYAAGNYGNSLVFGNLYRRSNYDVLVHTLEWLVKEKGPEGVFFVNDLIEEWAQLAALALKKEAAKRGWYQVNIRVLAGDISSISLPYSHTAHLKNPRIGLIHLDGKNPFFKKLAERSQSGLEITTHYPQILEAQAKVGHWRAQSLGEGERYRFPSGRKRRLPTQKFLLKLDTRITDAQILQEENLLLGRPLEAYIPPSPTWLRSIGDWWHAFLVTLGIRRQ